MSGPNPPGPDSEGSDTPEREPGDQVAEDQDATGETDMHSQAYSAPESEQFTSGPYVPPDPGLYDYDDYDPATELVDDVPPAALAVGGRRRRHHRRHLRWWSRCRCW